MLKTTTSAKQLKSDEAYAREVAGREVGAEMEQVRNNLGNRRPKQDTSSDEELARKLAGLDDAAQMKMLSSFQAMKIKESAPKVKTEESKENKKEESKEGIVKPARRSVKDIAAMFGGK